MIDSVSSRIWRFAGRLPVVAMLLAVGACSSHESKPAVAAAPSPAAVKPLRAAVTDPNIVSIFIYHISLPYGAASKNSAFWKLLDEDLIDVPHYATLNENGIRVGRGRIADWYSFRDILDKYSSGYSTTSVTGYSGFVSRPMDMTGPFQTETLFVKDEHGYNGRDYPLCTNQFSYACEWAPRKKNTVRVTICPVVTCVRQEPIWPFDLDAADVAMTQRENQYDLGLTADVGRDEFLAIGASSAADNPLTVGHQFLMHNRDADRAEDLLILIQKPVEFGSPPGSNVPATQPAALLTK